MAQNVIINGVTYQNVPEVDIPKSGGGTAKFYDTASADASGADLLTGKTLFGASGAVSGSMANNGGNWRHNQHESRNRDNSGGIYHRRHGGDQLNRTG